MPCYSPIDAWRSSDLRSINNRKWPLVFDISKGLPDTHLQIPCGQCLGCRLKRKRDWAIRMLHEAKLHENNTFVTLTYNDDNLPDSLDKTHFQLFMKRLREHYEPYRFRFFASGEYGEKTQRPHFHCILFGLNFDDKYLWTIRGGFELYRSSLLESKWRYGQCMLAEVNYDTVSYVAKYTTKKITGPQADDYYEGKTPEFSLMSRKPGIGRDYYEKYKNDFYNYDICVVRPDFVVKPPAYYDKLFDSAEPDKLVLLKKKRKQKAIEKAFDNTPERLYHRNRCAKLKESRATRSLEDPLASGDYIVDDSRDYDSIAPISSYGPHNHFTKES